LSLVNVFAVNRRQVADLVVVEKRAHTLKLYSKGMVLKTYKVALGPNIEGPKQQQGDGKTPEGRYTIDFRKADSRFHRALHVSYPNPSDIARARRRGVSPGGDIMIHGLPKGWELIGAAHRLKDWTLGCIAVTNAEIEEIWKIVPDRTPIEIRP
jgi:murein L,D-transpeptidase YafK